MKKFRCVKHWALPDQDQGQGHGTTLNFFLHFNTIQTVKSFMSALALDGKL